MFVLFLYFHFRHFVQLGHSLVKHSPLFACTHGENGIQNIILNVIITIIIVITIIPIVFFISLFIPS